MRFSSLLAVVLLAAAPALAQEPVAITPGHEDLAPNLLTYESETFDVRTAEPDKSIGSITQTVTMDGEYVVIVTDADVPQIGQVSHDSVRVLRNSLAPDYIVTTSQNGNMASVNFDALRVVGSYGPTGRTLPIDLDLKEPAFHAGGSPIAGGAALVARALPFRDGYVGTITTFSPTQRLREAALTVAGRGDAMRMDGSTVSAWVVEESSEPGGTVQRTYFIDPATREILKVTASVRGAETIIVPADPEAMAAEAAALASLPMIVPGDDALMPERVTPYEQTYTLQLIEPQEMEVGTVAERVMIDEAAGTITVVSRVDVPMQGSTQTDSTVAAYPSFAPISEVASGGGASIEVTYDDTAIMGMISPPDGDDTEIDETLDGPVFAASMVGQVLRALPLAEGYEARLMAYAPGGGVLPYVIEVTGMDEDTGGWTVAVTPEGAPASTYVIDPDTREILRSQIQPQVGVIIDIVPQG